MVLPPGEFNCIIPEPAYWLYIPDSNTVIGTLAVDGWTVTFGTARRGLGGMRPLSGCTKCNFILFDGTMFASAL